LIIAGRYDGACPPAESEVIAANIPDSRLVLLEHCGHQPHIEDPALFNDLLKRFLEGGLAAVS
jgi:pimeloyl-ACP methyl ester carboxylesterase